MPAPLRKWLPLLLLLGSLLPGPAAADDVRLETGLSAGEVAANLFLLPLAYAFHQPHHGFERYPYESEGYGRGDRSMAVSLRAAGQALTRGRSGGLAHVRVRGRERLGWDASWSGYGAGALKALPRADLYAGHVTANYVQSGKDFFELGLGLASLQHAGARAGPSAELNWESFPGAPWTTAIRYQAALLRGQGYHDVSVWGGGVWRGFGVQAGYGVFAGPAGRAQGPQFSLGAWF